jgi:hypothetical protein
MSCGPHTITLSGDFEPHPHRHNPRTPGRGESGLTKGKNEMLQWHLRLSLLAVTAVAIAGTNGVLGLGLGIGRGIGLFHFGW